MKIARFSTGHEPRYGIVQDGPGGAATSGESEGRILVLKGDPLLSAPEATGEVVDLADTRLLSPVIPRSKVVGFGRTYLEHVHEMGGQGTEDPVVFLKPNTAVIGPDAPIVLPAWSEEVHYEAELAVVIKTLAKDVPVERAQEVILGYTVANDVSARDRQRAEPQWVRAKAFDTSCPLGPWIEVPEPGGDFNPASAMVRARVDGRVVQEGSTRDLRVSIPELVSRASTIFTLLPGDVILTGTPAGVGEIRAGQRVEVEVEGIGAMSNPVLRR
ncbi:fumarylacetoacetate hydrolase family protein [Actinomyces slackii]|uniref:2-keto-4-pentenoate hydratase/2-oxohepta-3-ene-1,7-dioic acid hydratase (Catechol pathway) n=1 Tax=Actinomyces slackii TaxID=52774 RepID=A0A448KD80_9ACTO|nr:fumarylacetoacetate hydrolase family protein [Actinomyces slackii]VEG74840.1 2-keto-4-pentenoate hydratase/2-oxohepta-3-ene-1,7-dioic acid hydratase (catechol pathway) [Actinomyces slackii]